MTIGYAKGELKGDWAVFAKIAGFFVHKVGVDDRDDFFQNLLLEMVKVKKKYDAKGKTLTEAGLMLVASYELKGYWNKRKRRLFGLDCSNCTIEQRRECRTTKMPSQCPKGKAVRLLSLDKPAGNNDGNNNGDKLTKLNELITYTTQIDLAAKLDARHILQRLPKRLVKIGYKVYAGFPLETKEAEYLKRWRKAHLHFAPFKYGRDHLDERVLELLRKKPQGMTRSRLADYLSFSVRELNFLCLNQLVKSKQVIAVKRERTHGRITSLLFIAGAPIPEVRMVKEERDERIRQAYFEEGWSIKRIERELHHDKYTVRRAIGIKVRVRMDKEKRDERIRQAYFEEGWSIKRIKRELHHDKRTTHRVIRAARPASTPARTPASSTKPTKQISFF